MQPSILSLSFNSLRPIFAHFMLVHRDLNALPQFKNAVVTIGTFDGVHAGHRKIIEQLKAEAKQISGETVIITFHPHPRQVVREGQSPVPILTTLPEKNVLLEALQTTLLLFLSMHRFPINRQKIISFVFYSKNFIRIR